MNCTELDTVVEDAHSFFVESDGGFAISIGALAIVSLLLLVKGEALVRPLSALVAALVATGAVFVLSDFAEDMACMARVAVAATAGVLAAVLALCLFKTGLFLLGAAGFGVVGHFVYDALPLRNVPPPFVLMGRSGYYYLILLVLSVVGAVASFWQRVHFVRISSSLLGGSGVAWTVHLVADRASGRANTVPSLVLLILLLATTGVGVAVQYKLQQQRQRRRCRQRRARQRAEDSEDV